MNKKLRVFMLSLVVVMFAVSSVFAALEEDDIELNADDEYAPDAVATAGYNYSAKYVLSLTEWDDEETPDTRTLGNVSWEVYPRNPADTWFSYRIETSGNTSTIYLDGIYPPYTEDEAANNHYFMVAAHVSADVENDDYDEDTPGSQEYITQDVTFYAEEETPDDQDDEDVRRWVLVASEGADETTVGLFPDMVSVDASAVSDIAVARKDNYEVIIHFPTTTAITIDEEEEEVGEETVTTTTITSGDVFVNAQLAYTAPDPEAEEPDPEIAADSISLPSWLAYEVLEIQYGGTWSESEDVDSDDNPIKYIEYDYESPYVKTLRIFYSADPVPETEMFGTVRIVVDPSSTAAVTDDRDNGDANESTQSFADKYEDGTTIGWNVTFSPITPIALDKTEESITVKYGSSADITVNYSEHATAESGAFSFVPDLSEDVALTVTSASTGTDEAPAGTITIHVEPKKQLIKLYSTDLVVTDTNGLTATVRLNISVDLDPIAVTPESASIGVVVSASSDASFTVANNSGNVVWSFGTLPDGITAAGDDSGKYTVTAGEAATAGAYSFDIIAIDEAGRTASAVVYLTVLAGEITVAESGDAIPESLVINTGASNSYTLTAGNTYNAVKWLVSGAPEGMITPVSGDGSVFAFTINPATGTAGTYTATITAEDETGRTQTKSFSWTVRSALALTIDDATISVDYLSSKDAVVYYSYQEPASIVFSPDISADVYISYDIRSEGVGHTPDGRIALAVAPITPAAKLYTVDMIVTDGEGYEEVLPLYISVDVGALAAEPEEQTASLFVNKSSDVAFVASVHSGYISWDLGDVPEGITLEPITDIYDNYEKYLAAGIAPEVLLKYINSAMALGIGDADYWKDYLSRYNMIAAYTVTGVTEGTYSVDLTATDDRGETKTVVLNVSVLPPVVVISPDEQTVAVYKGRTSNVTFTASEYSGDVTWTLGDVPEGVTVAPATDTTYATEHNTVMVYTVTGVTEGTYSVDVAATDETGTKHATINVSVSAEPLVIDASGEEIPSSLVVNTNTTAAYTLRVGNGDGNITWSVTGDYPAGSITFTDTVGDAFTFVINALAGTAGTYTATITAEDETGRTQTKSFSWTVRSALELTVDSETVSVDYGSAKDISVYYDNQTPARVSFTNYDVFSADLEISYDISTSSVNSHEGVIVVTAIPIKPAAAVYNTEIVVTDSDGYTAAKTLNISVDVGALTVTPESADVSVKVEESADVTFIATIFSEKVTWTLGTIPAGITVAEGNGKSYANAYNSVTAYTITGVTAGSYSFDVTATDSRDQTATATVYVTVTDTASDSSTFQISPDVASVSLLLGESGNVSFTATGNSGDVTWTVGDVPAGITVTSNGNGSFTVTVATTAATGNHSISITATDADGHTATGTINADVASGNAPEGTFELVQPSVSATIAKGASREVAFTARNASGTVTWSADAAPAGITVTSNGNGRFTVTVGTTAATGNHSISVTAADSAGHTARGTIALTVTEPTPAELTLSRPTQNVSFVAGSSSTVTFTAQNASGAVTWSVGTVDSGVTVTSGGNGSFTVTGETAGTYTATVTARDAAGRTVTGTISITVTSPNNVPVIDETTINLNNETATNNIRQNLVSKLGSLITGTTEVAELPSTAYSGNVQYVSSTTVNIPAIKVTEAKIYVFEVPLDNLPVGHIMTWDSGVRDAMTNEFIQGTIDEQNAVFLDDNGNEITRVPANKKVNVAAYFEPDKIYEPTITAVADNSGENNNNNGNVAGVGKSSGGCSAGLGAMVSALAAAFFISKKRS